MTATAEWQRPPLQPGNELSMTHGARSPRRVSAAAQEVLAEAQEINASWLASADEWTLQAWCEAEGRCRLYRQHLAELPLTDGEGKPWAADTQLLRWEGRAAALRSKLGFDPLSRAALVRDVATASALDTSAKPQETGLAVLRGRGFVA